MVLGSCCIRSFVLEAYEVLDLGARLWVLGGFRPYKRTSRIRTDLAGFDQTSHLVVRLIGSEGLARLHSPLHGFRV